MPAYMCVCVYVRVYLCTSPSIAFTSPGTFCPCVFHSCVVTRVAAVLREMMQSEQTASSSLAIDARHLFDWSEEGEKLYHQLTRYPTEIIPIMDIVLIQEYETLRRGAFLPKRSYTHT